MKLRCVQDDIINADSECACRDLAFEFGDKNTRVHAFSPEQEAEIALEMYPGRVVKCKVPRSTKEGR